MFGMGVAGLVFAAAPVLSQPGTPTSHYKWKLEDVDRLGYGSRTVEVHVDSDKNVHLAYAGCNGEACEESALWYATRAPQGEWQKTLIDHTEEDVGRHASIETLDNGSVHILYSNHTSTKLKWAKKSSLTSPWEVQTLSHNWGGAWTRSASRNDKIFVTHTRFNKENRKSNYLELGTYEKGEWSFQQLEQGGWTTSVTTTADGRPVVSSHDGPYFRGQTHLTWWENNRWNRQPIDEQATKSDVVVDSDGFFHVVYCKSNTKNPQQGQVDDIFYATNSPDGIWKKHLVDGNRGEATPEEGTPAKARDVFFPSIAIDHNDTLHLTYRDYTQNQLTYARKERDGEWDYSALEAMGRPLYSRLFVDQSNRLHVAIENLERLYYGVCEDCTKRAP